MLYALLARLVEQGAVVKQALPGAAAGYALQPTPVVPAEPTTARADAPAEPTVVSDGLEPPSTDVTGEDAQPASDVVPAAPSTPEATPAREAPRTRRRAKAKPAAAPSSSAADEPSASESSADEAVQASEAASALSPQASPASPKAPRPRRPRSKPAAQDAPIATSSPTERVTAGSTQGDGSSPESTQRVSEPQKVPRSRRRTKPKPNAAG